ncbi:MAG TPA: ROK family protein [Gemmatimonadaceae bacterium]
MRIGIDLGGTKIEGVVLGADGAVVARKRVPTPRDYRATVNAIVELVRDLEADAGCQCTVGVGIPGTATPAGLVKNANSVWLIGHPLGGDLEALLGRPARLMNDANCFAISEAADGAGAGAEIVVGVILGTGVGGGIVVNGHCLEGANRIAGEWGHNPLPWPDDNERPGPACYCGRCGCIETFLSGPAFEREYAAKSGRALSAVEIVAAAERGDSHAGAALTRYQDRLARAFASLINVVDPDVIVLGGGMSNIPGLAESVTPLLQKYVFSDSVVTRIVRNVHGDSSGVRGAAWLWPALSFRGA